MRKRTYIGEKNIMWNGQEAEIMPSSRNKSDLTIRFEDGVTVKNVHLSNFRSGHVKNIYAPKKRVRKTKADERIGERRTMRNGIDAVITEYKDRHDMTIVFQDDGTEVKHTHYALFKDGRINKPKTRVGLEKVMKSGKKAVITEYRSCNDITVYFPETGETVKGKRYYYFNSGNIKGKKS